MNIMVTNAFLISQHAPSIDEPHIIISIRRPGKHTVIQEPILEGASDEWIRNNELKAKPNESCLGVHFTAFYDLIKKENHKKYGSIGPITDHQATDIVTFVHKHVDKVKLIVCQCDAGISRSAGLAAGLSVALHADDTHLYKNHYRPNVAVKNAIKKAYINLLAGLVKD
jgi:protein-tyrosine phosphatase